MTPLPPKGRLPDPPSHISLQDVAPRGLSRRGNEPPTQNWKVDAARGHSTIYVEHQGYSTVIGVDHPGLDPKGKHRHPGDWPSGDAMEVLGSHHQ